MSCSSYCTVYLPLDPGLSLCGEGTGGSEVVLLLQQVEGSLPRHVGRRATSDALLLRHVAQYVGDAGVGAADDQRLVHHLLNH